MSSRESGTLRTDVLRVILSSVQCTGTENERLFATANNRILDHRRSESAEPGSPKVTEEEVRTDRRAPTPEEVHPALGKAVSLTIDPETRCVFERGTS